MRLIDGVDEVVDLSESGVFKRDGVLTIELSVSVGMEKAHLIPGRDFQLCIFYNKCYNHAYVSCRYRLETISNEPHLYSEPLERS
jgi:hypothetical protein